MSMSYSQNELQEIFRDFDRDKSGTISGGELREVLRRLGHSQDECENIAQVNLFFRLNFCSRTGGKILNLHISLTHA